jgi:predicted Zn finger-like uncharacterized protein
MYTRCPQCKTVHVLKAEHLAQARGLVQCGPCGRTFSALSFLFDDWPAGEPSRPESGPGVTLPTLEPAPAEVAPEAEPASPADAPATEPPVDGDGDEAEPPRGNNHRLAWRAATVLLVLATAVNAAWTFREPLLNNPRISAWFNKTSETQVDEHGLLRDPQKIQLVSRDMHTHPTRSGILVLSLTFVNLAPHKQAFPELEVTLTDASNQPVARRRLQPAEYLRPGADVDAGLATDVYLPVLLELGDPGEQAVGFEISFL